MKIDLGLGVSIEFLEVNGNKISILDNKLPNDYWEQNKIRRVF